MAAPKPTAQPDLVCKLGVVALLKTGAMSPDEGVKHYLWRGAGRIPLIDMGSTNNTAAKAQAWGAKGWVELVEYPARQQQVQHCEAAFRHFGFAQRCEWLPVADLDEFWFCPDGSRLDQALAAFAPYDVIHSNGVMSSRAGLIDHPPGVREGFTRRRPGVDRHDRTKYLCCGRVLERPGAFDVHKVRGGRLGAQGGGSPSLAPEPPPDPERGALSDRQSDPRRFAPGGNRQSARHGAFPSAGRGLRMGRSRACRSGRCRAGLVRWHTAPIPSADAWAVSRNLMKGRQEWQIPCSLR
jgi:hypothetical protein